MLITSQARTGTQVAVSQLQSRPQSHSQCPVCSATHSQSQRSESGKPTAKSKQRPAAAAQQQIASRQAACIGTSQGVLVVQRHGPRGSGPCRMDPSKYQCRVWPMFISPQSDVGFSWHLTMEWHESKEAQPSNNDQVTPTTAGVTGFAIPPALKLPHSFTPAVRASDPRHTSRSCSHFRPTLSIARSSAAFECCPKHGAEPR